mmetsp:Transcript_2077/g.7867  ORF Transcript_2077/g.7867 Transcript_2077/m.7867 type:complete len:237 (+) Transcript_2077:430-1140(+)
MSAFASAPDRASALISSRNLTTRSSTGAIASSLESDLPPSPPPPAMSPRPIPPVVSATPRHARIIVTYLAADSTSSGLTASAATEPRYLFTPPTSSLSDLITAGVLMLSIIAACTPARAASIAEDSARSSSPQVCSWSTLYPAAHPSPRSAPLTEWKNSTNVFSAMTAASICWNPVTASPSWTGVRSMGSDHWWRRNKNLICLAVYIFSAARMVMKFLSDFDILSPSMWRWPVWTK